MNDSSQDSEKFTTMSKYLKPYQRAQEVLYNLPQKQQDNYKLVWKKSWIEYLSELEKWKHLIEENHPEVLDQAMAAFVDLFTPCYNNLAKIRNMNIHLLRQK